MVGFVAALAVVNILFAFFGSGLVGGSGIAWEAHLGGFLAGVVLVFLLAPGRPRIQNNRSNGIM